MLTSWAENLSGRAGKRARGVLRFVFYGRVSTEDWQDPVTSRARQREQAEALVRGHGQIVAELFDVGETGRWHGRDARRLLRWPPSSPIRTGGGTRS